MVVAIIALLVAILLPSLAKAREQARQAVCSSNAHQMAVAFNQYGIDHKYTPGHHLAVGRSDVLWPVRLMRYLGATGKRGGQHQVFWCPSIARKVRWNGIKRIVPFLDSAMPDEQGTFDYGYNDWGVVEFHSPHLGLGGHINDRNNGEVKMDRIKRPSMMIAIADNDSDDLQRGTPGVWDTAIDPIDDGGREWPGNRHNKGAQVVFCDGHAGWYLQARLVEKKIGTRQMWNNDYRSHCSVWPDKGAFKCPPGE